ESRGSSSLLAWPGGMRLRPAEPSRHPDGSASPHSGASQCRRQELAVAAEHSPALPPPQAVYRGANKLWRRSLRGNRTVTPFRSSSERPRLRDALLRATKEINAKP